MQIKLNLPKLHKGQKQVMQSDARFNVLSCGRRWGKSRLGSLSCVIKASEGKRSWWVAPTYPMAQVGWRMIRQLVLPIPYTQIRQQDKMIILPTGGTIQVKSADNPDSLRGEGLDYIVADECAFMKERAWFEALRPALADRQGDALFISTPKGRNWFWRLWHGADGAEWRSWQFTTYDNPYVKDSEVDAAKKNLPERIFRQEFLAEFIDDTGGVFRRVMECATSTRQEQPIAGHEYMFGVDFGKHNDFTVISVLDTSTNSQVYVDRFNQIDYMLQVGRLKALNAKYKPTVIMAERNAMGEPIIEQLLAEDMPVQPFTTNNASKAKAIEGLALAFERGDISILPEQTQIAELQAYEMERLPSGMLRYNAPSGMHDDTVIALALAWYGSVINDVDIVDLSSM